MTSKIIVRSGTGRSRRQRKPARETPGEAGLVNLLRPLKESPEEILDSLKPSSLTIRAAGGEKLLQELEEILPSLRPGSLTLGGDVRGRFAGCAELEQRLEQVSPTVKVVSLAIPGIEIPEEALEKLRKVWPLTIGDAGLQKLEQVLPSLKPGSPTIGIEKPASKSSKTLPGTQEIIDEYLTAKQLKVRPTTLRGYSDTLRPFAACFSTLPAEPKRIDEYLAPYGNETMTAKNIFIVIRDLYNFAEKRNRLPFPNPMPVVFKPGCTSKPPEHLTIKQARALLNAVEDDRERGIVYCSLGLGLRLREFRLIRVADVGEDTILVHGKERNEPMPLIAEIRDALLKLAEGKGPDEFIFSGRHGQPLSESMVQLIVKRLFRRAGISGVRPSPHTLRHSRGVITDIAGLDDYSSRRLLRHASTQMTDRYSALNLEELRAKEEKFNPLRVLRQRQELGKSCDFAQFSPDTIVSQDLAQLLPQLLDQLIALGQLAHEIRHCLGDDGHRPEGLKETAPYLEPSL